MRRLVLALACAGLAAPAFAQEASSESAGAVMRPTDAAFTCEQLVDEGLKISNALGANAEGSMFGRFGGVLRSGASLLVPGAGLVIAGADAMTQPERDARLAEDIARMNRWYYLSGLYMGRGCGQAQPGAAAAPPVN